jgi:hypothetical protein
MTSYDNFKKATLTAVVAAVLSLGLSLPAIASLIGDTITITSTANVPVDTWTDIVVVGAGAEVAGGDSSNHSNTFQGQGFAALFLGDFIDVGASSITINYAPLGPGGFNYAFITDYLDLDWTDMPGTLQSVTLADGATGLVASNISMITANGFQFQGTVDLITGANFTLNLTAVHVPEPTTLSVATIALLLGMSYRRRRRA